MPGSGSITEPILNLILCTQRFPSSTKHCAAAAALSTFLTPYRGYEELAPRFKQLIITFETG